MELILLQKVQNLGNLGDKVNVKPGYGRNFLVPQGKAVPATASNLADFEARRADYEAKAKASHEQAEARQAKLESASVTLYVNASTEGELYGSVGPRDIAEALTKAGHPVEKSEVVMGEGAIRHIAEFDVIVHLHATSKHGQGHHQPKPRRSRPQRCTTGVQGACFLGCLNAWPMAPRSVRRAVRSQRVRSRSGTVG